MDIYGFLSALVSGFFKGVFIFLIFAFLLCILRFLQKKMGVHQMQKVELRLPYDKVFNLCVESLRLINKCMIQKEDRFQGRIDAKVGMTWKSVGEIITFEIWRVDNNRTQVEISSRPALGTTFFDFGKNSGNVETIISFLKEHGEKVYKIS